MFDGVRSRELQSTGVLPAYHLNSFNAPGVLLPETIRARLSFV